MFLKDGVTIHGPKECASDIRIIKGLHCGVESKVPDAEGVRPGYLFNKGARLFYKFVIVARVYECRRVGEPLFHHCSRDTGVETETRLPTVAGGPT